MKKFMALLLVVFLFVNVANSQLRFGVKGGLNVSSLSTTSSAIDQVKAASSYQAGLLMQIKLGGFAFQPELLYSIKGGDLQVGDAPKLREYIGAITSLDYKTQNIDVPLNFQYGIDMGLARIYAQAGPYLSFQLAGALNGNTELYDKVDDNLSFNKFDWGIGLGVGVELFSFQIAAKYDFGMNSVGNETVVSSITNANVNPFYDVKNRNLNISLAYLF